MRTEQKKFIMKFAILCLILVLSMVVINSIYIHQIVNKKITHRLELEYDSFFSSYSNNVIDFAFFGDSHTWNAINPMYIPQSYNLAFMGSNYLVIYYALQKITQKDRTHVKYAVFEIDMHSFSESILARDFFSSSLVLQSKHIPLADIRTLRKNDPLVKILFEIYLPVLGQISEFKYLYLRELSKIYKGHTTMSTDFTKSDVEDVINKEYIAWFKNYDRIENTSMVYFLKSIKFAKENNISIIFIKYPLSKELNDYLQKMNVSRDSYYSEISRQINLTIGENYTVLDYHDYFSNSSFFYDSAHVNSRGAKLFSEKVYLDLKELNFTN